MDFSVILPIHNQESIIRKVLESVIEMTVGTYELILILDGCTDNTASEVDTWMQEKERPPTTILVNQEGKFETYCDNQGFRIARGKYLVEVQADMILQTPGYNAILASPLEQYKDLIAVSGRCCHGLNGNSPALALGKLGEKASRPHELPQDNRIYLSHTVNRGPLVLRRSMVETLGYLDDLHYTLGNDEHDLFARAWVQKRWRCGFVPIEVYSPLEWGSTRKKRSPEVQAYLEQRLTREARGFLHQNRQSIVFPPPEIRQFKLAF